MLVEPIIQITIGAFRVGGLLLAMPIIGAIPSPGPLKFILAIGIAFLLHPFLPAIPSSLLSSQGSIILVMAKEIGLGLFMGFMARFLFLVVTMALEFAGLQMGFAIANFFDPQNNSQISVLGQLGVVVTAVLFFQLNFHHDIFRLLIKSYEVIPISLPEWKTGMMATRLISFLSDSFQIGVRLALPVIVSMLTMHSIMGIIGRTAPQMNLFFNIAFIVNIFIGLMLMLVVFPHIFNEVVRMGEKLFRYGYGLW